MGAMELLMSFVQYGVIMIILAALAVGGIFIGKNLRKKKDEKELVQSSKDAIE